MLGRWIEVIFRNSNADGSIDVFFVQQGGMHKVNPAGGSEPSVRIGLNVVEILAAVIVEILQLNKVVGFIESIEAITDEDPVAERIGNSNDGNVNGVGHERRIDHVFCRG